MSAAGPLGITVLIPTQGRDTLERCLRSVVDNGLRAGDEVIVVIDAHGMTDEAAAAIERRVAAFGKRFRAVRHDAGGHTWGHCELNVGLELARPGNYITGNDDDDVYAPGAFAAFRAAIASDVPPGEAGEPRLHVFRFMPPWRSPLPEGRDFAEGRIGGHCMFVPNVPGKVGRFGHHYQGDWTYIAETIALWGGDDAVVLHDDIVAICRPD